MLRRHTTARLHGVPFVFLLGLAGCYASHETGAFDRPPVRDAGAYDAGVHSIITPDAGAHRDAAPPTCEPSGATMSIDLEPVSTATLCAYGHVEGASITGVEPDVAVDGVRIHTDFCPGADRDCRCDIVLGHVGADLGMLPLLEPRAGVTLDVDRNRLAITKVPTCECDGCGCDIPFQLYASVDDPAHALDVPSGGISFGLGDVTCPAPSECARTDAFALDVHYGMLETQVHQGVDAMLGPLEVRSTHDVVGDSPCSACATCGEPFGSWIAWIRVPRGV